MFAIAVHLGTLYIKFLGKGHRSNFTATGGTRDRRISIRGQIVAKKFIDEENRTARKSQCERIAAESRQCNIHRRVGPWLLEQGLTSHQTHYRS